MATGPTRIDATIAEGPGDFAYPIAIQTPTAASTSSTRPTGGRVINHAVFDEDWLLAAQKR